MKKFKYAIGIAAMALFGACSSDAPEIIDNAVDEGQEGMMYFSINVVGGDQTRGQSTSEAGPREDLIKSLSVVIYDDTETPVVYSDAISYDKDNSLAIFAVPSREFGDLKTLQANNKPVRVVVIANDVTDYSESKVDVLHEYYSNSTWGVDSYGSYNQIGEGEGYFMMSNAEACRTLLGLDGKDGKSEANAWKIAASLKLGRMCTRFEYGTDNKVEYPALHESGLKMKVAGFSVKSHASNVYYIPTFSPDGHMPTDHSADTHCHYTKDDDNPYRVTSAFPAATLSTYANHNYSYLANTDNKRYAYVHPNTFGTDFTPETNPSNKESYKANFKKIPYVAVKVQFECTNFAGTGQPSASMTAGDEVYSVGGIFIGGVKDYFMIKNNADENKRKFSVNLSDETAFNTTEKDVIQKLVAKYNEILEMKAPSEKNSTLTQGGDEDQTWFKELFIGKDVYTKSDDGKYYTYYSQLIINDENADTPQWKYGLSRNTSYALAVKSIKYLGATSGKVPGDGPTDADFSELFISLSITVNSWAPNFSNIDMKL